MRCPRERDTDQGNIGLLENLGLAEYTPRFADTGVFRVARDNVACDCEAYWRGSGNL
jgi:hypothetical protein